MATIHTIAKRIRHNASLAILVFIASIVAAKADDAVMQGQVLAQKRCSSCHAVGVTGTSKLANAPPMRDLANRWKGEQLAEALAEGITTAHEAMPEFRLTSEEISAFVAYFDDLGLKVQRSNSNQ